MGRRQWRRRPLLSALIRATPVTLPALAALGAAVGVSHLFPRPTGIGESVLWYVAISAIMLAAVLLMERAAQRLLPLASLLSLALLVPDDMPRRFAVARRVGRPSDLKRRAEELRDAAPGGSELDHMVRVLVLVAALSAHEHGTRGHSERVRVFTEMIAAEMGLAAEDRGRLAWMALLHDIGKLLVPAEILIKPGALNASEWEVLRRHPDDGAVLIAPLNDWLGPWAATVAQHHERWNGTGYPRGLQGTEISLGARIVSVADAYEVMTAPRPYRKALGVAPARQELVRCAGTQFDPAIVRAFLNISVGRLWRAVGVGAWAIQLPGLSWLGWLGASPGAAAVATGATVAALSVAPLAATPLAASFFSAATTSQTAPAPPHLIRATVAVGGPSDPGSHADAGTSRGAPASPRAQASRPSASANPHGGSAQAPGHNRPPASPTPSASATTPHGRSAQAPGYIEGPEGG